MKTEKETSLNKYRQIIRFLIGTLNQTTEGLDQKELGGLIVILEEIQAFLDLIHDRWLYPGQGGTNEI